MGQFRDALDKQFPPKTEAERRAHKVRRAMAAAEPAPLWSKALLIALLFAIPLVYSAASHAGPASFAPMAAAVTASKRSESEGPARSDIEKLADACIRDLSKCPKEASK